MGDKHPVVSFVKAIDELILYPGQTVTVRLVEGLPGDVGRKVVLRVTEAGEAEVFLEDKLGASRLSDYRALFAGDRP